MAWTDNHTCTMTSIQVYHGTKALANLLLFFLVNVGCRCPRMPTTDPCYTHNVQNKGTPMTWKYMTMAKTRMVARRFMRLGRF